MLHTALRRRLLVAFSGLACLTNAERANAQRTAATKPTADTTAYIYLRNADTIAVERIIRSADGVRGELVPKGQPRFVWFQHIGAGNTTGAFDLDTYAPGSGPSAAPLQRATLRVAGDSGLVDLRANGTTNTTQRLPLPAGSEWMFNNSVLHTDLLATLAKRRGESRVNIVLAVGAQQFPLTWHMSGDTLIVLVATNEERLQHDSLGLTQAIVGPGLMVKRMSATMKSKLSAPPSYAAPANAPYTAEDVMIHTSRGYDLAATLTRPRGVSKAPVVITISGSGPQERDSRLAGIEGYAIFREVADTLGRRGIAVLRIDDRGVGASGGIESRAKATSADFADDVRSAVTWLRARTDIDAERVALLGHSEGGIIAPMVASTDQRIRAIVLLAGQAYTGRRVLMFQNQDMLNQNARLNQAQRDSVMRTVPAHLDSIGKADPWFGYFMQYDPLVTARLVKQPVLVLQGATDRQVTPEQADTLTAALRAAGNTHVTMKKFPTTDHLFLADAMGVTGDYATLPDKHVRKEVLGTLADWLVVQFK